MFRFIILVLATWRVSAIIKDEGGPYDILEKLRLKIGVRYNEFSQRYGQNTWADGILCTYCNSVWVGILFAILYAINKDKAEKIGMPFALSAMAILFDKVVDKL